MLRDDSADRDEPVIGCHLLGLLPLGAILDLQARLLRVAAASTERRGVLLLCEHEPEISIGRDGSRLDVRGDDAELERRAMSIRRLARCGGTIVHAPGQLAAYAVIPLAAFGLSVGRYLEAWQSALEATAADVGFAPVARPGRYGLWGRGGRTAFLTAAVRDGLAHFGAYLNVAPSQRLIHLAAGGEEHADEPSTWTAETRRPVRMPTVRHSLAARLSTALGCERYHMFTGHPQLPHFLSPARDSARVE